MWLALALSSTDSIILLHDTSTQDKAASARMPRDDVGASIKVASRPIRISASRRRHDSGKTAIATASIEQRDLSHKLRNALVIQV
jgi:hypothetical protein